MKIQINCKYIKSMNYSKSSSHAVDVGKPATLKVLESHLNKNDFVEIKINSSKDTICADTTTVCYNEYKKYIEAHPDATPEEMRFD